MRKYPADFAAQIFIRGIHGASPRVKHHGPVFRKCFEPVTYGLSHAPFQPVALDRISQRTRNGKAGATGNSIAVLMQTESSKVAARHTDTGLIDLAEFSRPEDPSRFGE